VAFVIFENCMLLDIDDRVDDRVGTLWLIH
jgi:hypothetical protein